MRPPKNGSELFEYLERLRYEAYWGIDVPYEYHNLDWANWPWTSCRKPFHGFDFRGRCELKRNHKGDHAAERGMIWLRFDDDDHIWLTTPGSKIQDRYW